MTVPRFFRNHRALTLFLVWLLLVLGWGGLNLYQYARERSEIYRIVASLELKGKSVPEITAKIQSAVKERISTEARGRFYKKGNRPALRHTAIETWSMAEGQCGEGARLVVNLLQAAGVPASRVNFSKSTTSFYHTAAAYQEKGDWWLLDTINSPSGFHEWSRANDLPLSSLVAVKMHRGGALLIKPNNPFFDRYSYGSWARLFGARMEVNQFRPFPQWVNHILENPPLLLFLLKVGVVTVLLSLSFFVGLVVVWIRGRRRTSCPAGDVAPGQPVG